MGSSHLSEMVASFCLILATLFIWSASRARQHARRLKRSGLPMPPHSIISGHLMLLARIKRSLPSDAHTHYLADQIRRLYPELGPAFYLDLWPFSEMMLVVTDPAMIAQFCQPDHLLPKHPGIRRFLYPMTGGYDLNCLSGEPWKYWRKLFNPGFSPGHIQSLVPGMVEDALVFRDQLAHRAEKGGMFSFEDRVLNLTIDMIGRVALDSRLDTQKADNPMITALLDQRRWAAFGLQSDFLTIINPLRYLHIWKNRRIMDAYINNELDARYVATQGARKSKTIIDLALNGYTGNGPSVHGASSSLDPTFRKYAISQVKVFIFAGHDATSTTICYAWLMLSRHPEAMARIRAEHDAVFGPEAGAVAASLVRDPALLNRLPYTLAVIREALRLFPAVSSPRQGLRDFVLTDGEGRRFPTDRCLVWANHHGLHSNPLWWKRAEEFLPERWLDESMDTDLRPLKNAWRPFEFGPRVCIGRELALADIKVVLALTVREFELEEAYSEWDRDCGTLGIKRVNGERAYQVQLGSAHPADGFPVRVRRR